MVLHETEVLMARNVNLIVFVGVVLCGLACGFCQFEGGLLVHTEQKIAKRGDSRLLPSIIACMPSCSALHHGFFCVSVIYY